MQLPEITIASQSLLKTGFRNANQVEVLPEVGYGLDDAILDDFIVRKQENDRVYGISRWCAVHELLWTAGQADHSVAILRKHYWEVVR